MWPPLLEVDPGPLFPKLFQMIVEVPKGSTNKYEYDAELGVFRLDRVLYSPMHFPGDYGFVPGTIADDGEPLDVLCLTSYPSFTGCCLEVRPVGMLDMRDVAEVDHKILAVPSRDPRFGSVNQVDDLTSHVRREVEHFFTIYKELELAPMSTEGWRGMVEAHATLRRSREAFFARDPACG